MPEAARVDANGCAADLGSLEGETRNVETAMAVVSGRDSKTPLS